MPESAQRRMRPPYERLSLRLALWNRRPESSDKTTPAAPPGATTLARLREHYVPDTERLAALLGMSPTWSAAADRTSAGSERQLARSAGPGTPSSADSG
jgi:hypothetical protein